MRFALSLLLLASSALAEEGFFPGSGGTALHYRFRPGAGEPIVLVHGFMVASEGWLGWEAGLFPDRPLLSFDRRGYPPSEGAPEDYRSLALLNNEDVGRAVAFATAKAESPKAGVVAISLGAHFLERVTPERVRWIALLNPGGVPLVPHQPPMKAALSWSFNATAAGRRFWLPTLRRAWERGVIRRVVTDLARLLADPRSPLVVAAEERFAQDPWAALVVEESLCGLFGHAPAWAPVPILIAVSDADELIPAGAYAELRSRLPAARNVSLPGGHLAPLTAPAPWIAAVTDFVLALRP